MQTLRKVLPVLPVLFLVMALHSVARDDYIEVSHQELLEYPQKYWSQGIVFKDKLTTGPEGRTIRLGEKIYTRFQTENLGACYADRDVLPQLKRAVLNREYIFQGTVLHQPSSFFSRSPSFYVVVQQLTPAVDGVEVVKSELFKRTRPVGSPVSSELMSQVQQDLIGYARQQDLTLRAVFSDTEQRGRAANIVYAAIAGLEQRENITARKLLGDFIMEVFAAEYGGAQRAAVAQPQTTPAVRAASEEVPTRMPDEGAQSLVGELDPEELFEADEMQESVAYQRPEVSVKQPDEEDPGVAEATASEEQERIARLRERVSLMLKPGISVAKPQVQDAPVPATEVMEEPEASDGAPMESDAVPVDATGAALDEDEQESEQQAAFAGPENNVDQEDNPLAVIFPEEYEAGETGQEVFRRTPQE